MKRRSVGIVTSHFWPMMVESSQIALRLSDEYSRLGYLVDVITPRWVKVWPERFRFRNSHVIRTSNAGVWSLGSKRLSRAMARTIRQSHSQYDHLVFAHDATLMREAIETAAETTPSIVRVDPDHPAESWLIAAQKRGPLHLVAACHDTYERLILDGAMTEQTHLIRDGAVTFPLSQQGSRQEVRDHARGALGLAHYILQLRPHQKLAVCFCDGRPTTGLRQLIESWRQVDDQFPGSRLWILSESTNDRRLWDWIADNHLTQSVFLVGQFEDPTIIFDACDLMISARTDDHVDSFTRDAIHNGIPTVAFHSSELKLAGGGCPNIRLAKAGNVASLAARIVSTFQEDDERISSPSTDDMRSVVDMVGEYLGLFAATTGVAPSMHQNESTP